MTELSVTPFGNVVIWRFFIHKIAFFHRIQSRCNKIFGIKIVSRPVSKRSNPSFDGLSYQKTTRKIMMFKAWTSNKVRLWLMDRFTLIWISFRFPVIIDGRARMLASYLNPLKPGCCRCCFFLSGRANYLHRRFWRMQPWNNAWKCPNFGAFI